MSEERRVLVIEDQEDIGALIALNLESLGCEVTHCTSGRDGYNKANQQQWDAIVLDIMLPEMDGLEICRTLRENENFTPILMLTAKKTEADRVLGLDLGADDYLTKPFSVRELQARVKALLRRSLFNQGSEQVQEKNDESLRFDDLVIDVSKRVVILADKNIALTAKEFDLLLYMANYPGIVFTREQLLNAVWGYHHNGFEHTVNSHINRLRSKLESGSNQPKYVLTVWGVGYKFYD